MTTGLSGTYAFNGTNINQNPTTHRWVERNQLGIDGGAHPVYPAVRSFEMTWNLISPENAKQLIDFYSSVGNTGTITSCLPQWGSVDYRFKNYSGTTLAEPQMQGYFNEHIEELTLLIMNINTSQ
jgi:hypothetical protein